MTRDDSRDPGDGTRAFEDEAARAPRDSFGRTSDTRVRLLCLLLCYAIGQQPASSAFAPTTAATTSTTRVAGSPAPASRKAAPKRRAAGRDNELLVRLREQVPAGEVATLLASVGVERRGKLRGPSGVERLALAEGRDAAEAVSVLSASPLVEFAESDVLITADQAAPNDVRFPEQWALRNDGQAGGRVGADIGAGPAWISAKGSPRTVVAVVDGGIDFDHADLRGNRWFNPKERRDGRDNDGNGLADDLHGWDWVADSGEVKDEHGHGTAVAGLIAAEGNNGAGVVGVMWHASLLSLRVLDGEGRGYVADAVEAIDYATARGAHVVNLSWGSDEPSAALRAAIQRATDAGVVVVCSAGNSGRNIDASPRYPASFDLPGLISVGSTDDKDAPAAWSNWGARACLWRPRASVC